MSSPEVSAPEAPTPEERRAARRANQTTFNLVLALVASLGIVVFLVAVVVRPEVTRDPVDYRAVGANAQAADARFVVPTLPDTWWSNRSVFVGNPTDGVVRWETGLVTPQGDFIAVVQGIDANDSWIAGQTANALNSAGIRLGGLDWLIYDRRNVDNPGNRAYALVTTSGDLTVVLYGTAADDEFVTLAETIAKELP